MGQGQGQAGNLGKPAPNYCMILDNCLILISKAILT
jgi:hypothetical protein